MPFPIVAVVGMAISYGAKIFSNAKAKKALHDGKSSEQLKLIQRFYNHVLAQDDTRDYKKMNGGLYGDATNFFSAVAGVPIEEHSEMTELWNGGQNYLNARNGHPARAYGVTLEEANKAAQRWRMVFYKKAANGDEWGAVNNKPYIWNESDVAKALADVQARGGYQMRPDVQTAVQITSLSKATAPAAQGAVSPVVTVPEVNNTLIPNSSFMPSTEILPAAGITANLESPLKTYWYLFAAPVVLLIGWLVLKRKKR